jgi:hypothetical protein
MQRNVHNKQTTRAAAGGRKTVHMAKTGRPKTSAGINRTVTFILRDEDVAAIDKLVEHYDCSRSELVRRAIQNFAVLPGAYGTPEAEGTP